MIILNVCERQATALVKGRVTTDSVGLPVEVNLSPEYDGLPVWVCFRAGETAADVALMDGTEVEVPSQCLQVAGEALQVGVWAGDGDGNVRIPTVWASAGTIKQGTERSGIDPSTPEPDWAAQVQQAAAQAVATANSVRADADAGVFDGEDGYSPSATVTQGDGFATITITDKDGTTTATVHDGTDGRDGTDGADGYSPTARVTQTASGATITITDKDGTTTASVSNGTDGTDGTDGFSPTVDVQAITGGHEVTITDADGAHNFEVMDGDPSAPGSITDEMLAPDGVKAQVAQLFGNQLTGTLSGSIDTAADAYAAPPMALTVNGASTQAGTPTPENPVPIESVDGLTVHASADGGTTDYTNWPVSDLLPEGTVLRSLPDGTKDELHLSYLRPSTRAGWAWYGREVVQVVGSVDMGTLTWSRYAAQGTFVTSSISDRAYGANGSGMTTIYGNAVKISGSSQIADYGDYTMFFFASLTNVSVHVKDSRFTVTADYKDAVSGVVLYYALATPVTTQLDPIELPELPAPTCTVWCDGGSAQPTFVMEYVQDTNLVIADLRAALADLATS